MTLRSRFVLGIIFGFALLLPLPVVAQDGESTDEEMTEETEEVATVGNVNPDFLAASLLTDNNGDGIINAAGFGDSLVRGVGDFVAIGEDVEEASTPGTNEAGYPLRVESLVGIDVANLGDPGERLATAGLARFAQTVPGLGRDIIAISGGANDAVDAVDPGTYSRSVQTMINIAFASNITPVLVDIPPICCNRVGLNLFTSAYNNELRALAAINNVRLAEANTAFTNTCETTNCFLLNLPEGLHPNIRGYDVMGEAVIAALLGINLFAFDGPANLEAALNLPAGTVNTVPSELPPEESDTGEEAAAEGEETST